MYQKKSAAVCITHRARSEAPDMCGGRLTQPCENGTLSLCVSCLKHVFFSELLRVRQTLCGHCGERQPQLPWQELRKASGVFIYVCICVCGAVEVSSVAEEASDAKRMAPSTRRDESVDPCNGGYASDGVRVDAFDGDRCRPLRLLLLLLQLSSQVEGEEPGVVEATGDKRLSSSKGTRGRTKLDSS